MSDSARPPYSAPMRQSLAYARLEAGRLLHSAIEPAHLLLGVLRQGENLAARLIQSIVQDTDLLRLEIESLAPPALVENIAFDLQVSAEAQATLAECETLRRQFSHPQIHTIHLLVILTLKTATPLARLLEKRGVTYRHALDGMISEFGLFPGARASDLLIVQHIVKEGLLTPQLIHLIHSREKHSSVTQVILTHHVLSEEQIAKIYAKHAGLQTIQLQDVTPDPKLIAQFPADLARRLRVFPLHYEKENDSLTIAIADPFNNPAAEEIQNLWGVKVITLVAPESLLLHMIQEHFGARPE